MNNKLIETLINCDEYNNIINIIDNINTPTSEYIKHILIQHKELQLCNINKVNNNLLQYFTFNGKSFDAKFDSVYDGDTFTVIFNYNGEIIKYKCRCYGYDSPEIKPLLTKENREDEIKMAIKAKNKLLELLNKSINGIIKIECLDFDKYGRILANVYNYIDTDSINNIMIKEGYGKSYFGGTKK